MTGVIATIPKFQFSANGVPLVSGTLTVYLAGTTTPTDTWQDSALTILNTNPVVLDARGECVLWLDSTKSYKFLLKNAAGVTQWTQDNISGSASVASLTGIFTKVADLAAPSGSSLVGYQPSGTGAVATTVQGKLRESVSVKDFGAVGDGVTDDSVAIGKAILWATTPVSIKTKTLEWPNGTYLVTQNNWIGANLGTSAYGGLLDTCFSGVGRNSSTILFKPTVANAYCYDQSDSPANPLIGFSFSKIGVSFDNSANGSQPIHFLKSIAGVASGGASQNYRLHKTRFDGVTGSILFTLNGIVNEDMISCYNTRVTGYKSIVLSTNLEALIHNFYSLDLINITGDAFDYWTGGSLGVYGCNYIADGTLGIDTALLRLRGSTTGQNYYFNNVRSELRGATTRILIMDLPSENTIVFDSCELASNIPNNQAWAIVPVQHHASISFNNCILPTRTGVGYAGAFLLQDSTSGADYDINGAARTKTRFENCDQPGSRNVDTQQGWVDWSALTGPNANYTTSVVTYKGCGNVQDSIEYGHPYRYGKTFLPDAPAKLVFRGNTFPTGDGVSAAVVSQDDLNVIVSKYNFVTEIVVMRTAMATAATNYQIEFIDTLERAAPGTGVIFGETTAKANNLAIFERVQILRQFSGTIAQRTIWCRMKAGFTLGGSVGTPMQGGIYAEVL